MSHGLALWLGRHVLTVMRKTNIGAMLILLHVDPDTQGWMSEIYGMRPAGRCCVNILLIRWVTHNVHNVAFSIFHQATAYI
eukprot:5308432-Karenia_brevis.AAC.1